MLIPEVDGEFAKFVHPAGAGDRQRAVRGARWRRWTPTEWSARFDEFGVPYAPVQTRAEWAASETVAANDLLLPVPGDDGHGRTRAARGALAHARIAGRRRDGDRRRTLARHRDRTPALPLDGMLVVDATKFLAGPFGCLVLQDLGARVVKVDPPGGEDFRTVAAASYSRAEPRQGPGLPRPQGRQPAARRSARWCTGPTRWSRTCRARWPTSWASTSTASAPATRGSCTATSTGGAQGPLADTPGFDPLLQARSGLMVAQGGADHPVIQPMSLHDIGTGTLAAFGTIAGAVRAHPSRRGSGRRRRAEPYVGRVPGRRVHDRTRPRRPRASGTSTTSATSPTTASSKRPTAGSRSPRPPTSRLVRDPWSTIRSPRRADASTRSSHACRAAGVPAIAVLGRDEVYTSATLAEPAAGSPSTTTTSARCR